MRFARNSDREIGDWFLDDEKEICLSACSGCKCTPAHQGESDDRTGRDRGERAVSPADLGARSAPRPTGLSRFDGDRKQYPIATGVLDFFTDAIAEVAHVSFVATQQHHPGEPVHWDKQKSTDEPDALVRHLMERGQRDSDGLRHSAKVAWRALALLQREIEAEEAFETAIRVMDDPAYPGRCLA